MAVTTATIATGGTALVVAAAVLAPPAAQPETGENRATVVKIVDGDTLDVTLDAKRARIRLLNIDTPESVDPNRPVECLAQEASAHLASLLPLGSTVELKYDQDRTDPYGRTLAAVYKGGDSINVAMAEAGFGVPVTVEPNHRFRSEIDQAWARAQTNGVGLFNPAAACTIPGRVTALSQQAAGLSDAGAQATTALVTSAEQLEADLASTQLPALALAVAGASDDYRDKVTTVKVAALTRAEQLQRVAQARQKPTAPKRPTSWPATPQRPAPAAPAPSPARPAPAPAPAPATVRTQAPSRPAPVPTRPAVDPRYDGYTGCRDYSKTGSIDEKGRPYRKISCERPAQPAPAQPAPVAPAPKPAKPGVDPRYDGYTGCRDYSKTGSIDEKGRPYKKIAC